MTIEPLPRPTPRPPGKGPLRHGDTEIRLIATDIDGTLTDMRRLLEWDAVTALRQAEALGVPVILATGNVVPCTKTFQHAIGTTGPIVCENGGTLFWDLRDTDGHERLLHEALFARDPADAVVAELRRRGHHPRYISSDPWRESEAALELSSIDEDVVRGVVADLGHDDLYVVATGFACHILHRDIDKASGLRQAIAWMNTYDPRFAPDHPEALPDATPLTLDATLALGDSMNDLQMFQACGAAAALPHAPPRLKEAATFVTERPHGAGVLEALRRCGL